jgi:hypothetical protein
MRTPSGSVVLAVSLLVCLPAFASIPLPSVPSWTSNDNDYSTGGAFADIDGDGWLDLLTSNGNDMDMDFNGVYMNNLGTLEVNASWRSSDAGYFGHCYAGDVDNDGDEDLAVSYLGRGDSGELTARIYRNEGGTLETAPWWKAADQHSSFDCCLGDVDLDGDLDLAISAGDAYAGETDSVRIYRNNSGAFDTLPFWTAQEGTASDAIRFCDIDNDGDLDLFVGQRRRVSMYRNNNGTLESVPSWVASTGVGWVLRLALADYDGDAFLDLAVASNGQIGDPNSIKVFHNSGGTLDTLAAFTMLGSNRYSSCVAWADVNGDGYADLAAGGWWNPAVVFENHAGLLDTTPTWSWSDPSHLVCEAIVWGDLTNGHLTGKVDSFNGDGQRKLFSLRQRPVQLLDSVCVDGVRVPAAGYCSDPLVGWVSFASVPPPGTSNVIFFYRYSMAPDLAVTNWDASHGNHVFLNTTPVGIAASPRPQAHASLRAWPNPAARGMTITLSGVRATAEQSMRILDMAGREVRVLNRNGDRWSWDGSDNDGRPVATGIYLAECGKARLKLVRLALN